MRRQILRQRDESTQAQRYRTSLDGIFSGKRRGGDDAVDDEDGGTPPHESEFVDIAPFTRWLNPDYFDFDTLVSHGVADMRKLVPLVNSWMHHSTRYWTAKHLAEATLLSPARRCVIRSHYDFPASTTKGSRPQVLNAYLPAMFELAYAGCINDILMKFPSYRQLRKALECVLDQYAQPSLYSMFGAQKGGWRWSDTDRRIRDEDEDAEPVALEIDDEGPYK